MGKNLISKIIWVSNYHVVFVEGAREVNILRVVRGLPANNLCLLTLLALKDDLSMCTFSRERFIHLLCSVYFPRPLLG